MAYFTELDTVFDTNNTHLQGLSDLECVVINGVTYVLAAAQGDSALTSFRVENDGSLTQISVISNSATSGTNAITNVELIEVNGEPCLITNAGNNDDAALYEIASNGALTNMGDLGANAPSDLNNSFCVEINGQQYLYGTQNNQPGFLINAVQDDGSVIEVGSVGDTASTALGDVAAFAQADINGSLYLFTVSAFDAGLTSFVVGANGALTQMDMVLPSDGSGFSLAQAVETIKVENQTYVLMGSAGTNSITVYSVSASGQLTETDHLMDTGETRFQDITTLKVFTVGDQNYVLTAGSDDGITLLHLNADGQLEVVDTLADDFGTSLQNVSDIEVMVNGSDVMVFVSSETENGVTNLSLDVSGFVPGANVETDGGTDGETDGGTDGETGGGTEGETDGGTDGETGGGTEGETDGGTDGETGGGTEGETGGETDGETDGGTDGETDGGADGGTDGGTDGSTETSDEFVFIDQIIANSPWTPDMEIQDGMIADALALSAQAKQSSLTLDQDTFASTPETLDISQDVLGADDMFLF